MVRHVSNDRNETVLLYVPDCCVRVHVLACRRCVPRCCCVPRVKIRGVAVGLRRVLPRLGKAQGISGACGLKFKQEQMLGDRSEPSTRQGQGK